MTWLQGRNRVGALELPVCASNPKRRRTALSQSLHPRLPRSILALDGDTAVRETIQVNNLGERALEFTRSGSSWTQRSRLPVAEDDRIEDVDLDGDTVAILQWKTVHVFVRRSGAWERQLELQIEVPAQDWRRIASAIALQGDWLFVSRKDHNYGFESTGVVDVYHRRGGVCCASTNSPPSTTLRPSASATT